MSTLYDVKPLIQLKHIIMLIDLTSNHQFSIISTKYLHGIFSISDSTNYRVSLQLNKCPFDDV